MNWQLDRTSATMVEVFKCNDYFMDLPSHSGWTDTKCGIWTRKQPKHPCPDFITTPQWLDRDQMWHLDPKTTQTPSSRPQYHHTVVGPRPMWHLDPKTTQTPSSGPQNHHTVVGPRPKVAFGPENHPNTLVRTSKPPRSRSRARF